MQHLTTCALSATSLAVAVALAPQAFAQSSGAEETVIVYGTQGTTEIYTGSRLNLTVIETPATVDVIDGDAIRDRVDLNVMDAVTRSAGFTPEVNPGNGHSSIQARGFTGSNSVTKLYDGNPVYSIAGVATLPQDTWSLDRIEVLKGPSAVLYGQGGIGGAINLIPRQPQFEDSSQVRVLVGEDNTSFVGVDFTGGLTETIAYRFDYSQETSDGWVSNGDSETEHLSLALLWQASDDFSLTARFDQSDEAPMAYFGSLVSNGAFIEEFVDINFNVSDADIRYEDQWLRLKSDWAFSDNASLQVEFLQMNADRWWRNAEYQRFFPEDGLVAIADPLILGHDIEQTGVRAMVNMETESGIKTVFGMEVNDLSFERPYNNSVLAANRIDWTNIWDDSITSVSQLEGLDGIPGVGDFHVVDPYNYIPGSMAQVTDALVAPIANSSDVDQMAFFGEAQFKLTDQLALVGALRFEEFDTLYVGAGDTFTYDGSTDAVTGRLGLVYDLSDNTAIYGQYGTGAEHPSSSVVNIRGNQRVADMIDSEQIEVGIKNSIGGTGLQWSLAVFDITKNNLVIDDPDSSDPDDVQIINEQTSTGFEAGLNYALTDAFQVHANLVSLDAETDSGDTPNGVPDTTWNTGFAWSASPSVRFVADARFVDDRPTGGAPLPSYTVFDASAHWRVSDRLDFILKVDNLTDELYAVGSYWSGTWLAGKPRTFSIAADFSF